MIIRNQLGDFYRKSEVEFLGKEINFRFMTPKQLDQAIAESIALYTKLYPPKKKSGFSKFMETATMAVMVAGTAGVAGAAILSAYGVGVGTALGTVFGAGTATAAAGSTIASVQTAASAVAGAGLLYGKVTGDTPEDLVKAAQLVKSENALDAMQKVATEELHKKGVALQADDTASNDALRERLKKEQQLMSEKLTMAANQKAEQLGQPTPTKSKFSLKEIGMIAVPIVLAKFIG